MTFLPTLDENNVAHTRSPNDKAASLLTLFASFMIAVIGSYVGLKGPVFGADGMVNRARGTVYCIYGVGMLIGGVGLTALVSLIGWAAGLFVMVFHGLIAVGAVSVMIGVTAILTGRDIAAQSVEAGSDNDQTGDPDE